MESLPLPLGQAAGKRTRAAAHVAEEEETGEEDDSGDGGRHRDAGLGF